MASAPPPPLGEDPPFAPTLAAARIGATWALKQLYHHHAPQVAGYLGRRGVPDVEASTKAVFLRMARNLARFEGGEDDFRAMLFSFTRGQAVEDLGEPPTQPLADPHQGDRRHQDAAATPVRPRPGLSSALSSPAAARLRTLVGAHPGWISAVVALALVAVVVAAGAPSLLPSASRPKLGAVDVSPPGPSAPTQSQPKPADGSPPSCPGPTSGSSTTSTSTPASACVPAASPEAADDAETKSSTATEPKATTTTTTTVRRSATTQAPPPTTPDEPSTSTSAPRRRSTY